jgi:hypothetical protein
MVPEMVNAPASWPHTAAIWRSNRLVVWSSPKKSSLSVARLMAASWRIEGVVIASAEIVSGGRRN